MRKLINAIVLVPLALVLLAFAVANRRFVTVSFNPLDADDLALALTLPLFIVIIASAVLGVIAGGIATWIGQRHWRRAARRHEAEAATAREQAAALRSQISVAPAPRNIAGPAIYGQQPLAIDRAIERDKHGATL